MRELLSYNSLFVGQLYEDKSLALSARDLIFFTTDLQTVNYYTTIQQFTARADLFLKYIDEVCDRSVVYPMHSLFVYLLRIFFAKPEINRPDVFAEPPVSHSTDCQPCYGFYTVC